MGENCERSPPESSMKLFLRGLRLVVAFFLLAYGFFNAWLILKRSPLDVPASAIAGTSALLAIGAMILWLDVRK